MLFNTRSLILLVMVIAAHASALCAPGATPQSLSPADSARLKCWIDSTGKVPVYSMKRQRYLDSALAIVPSNAYWWQQKAMPLYKLKKYDIAERYLDSAVKYDAMKYIDYRGFMKCIFSKRYQSAKEDFRQSKQIIGDGAVMDHTYDFYIGLCCLQLNELDSATQYLEYTVNKQRTTLGSKWVHPLDVFYLGIAYYEEERYTEAIAAFDTSIQLYPQFSDAKYYKSLCLWRMGKEEESKAVLADARKDINDGYTIVEDNEIYEKYPYQIDKRWFR